ncbi:hypothetical protein K501DRAFT_275579 [Backusella circina FSU 941]|nr:hypothetical protein K501DRAFT_275579 [Backusella circina FSU 941]
MVGFIILILLSTYYYYYYNDIDTLPLLVITCISATLVLVMAALTQVETANSDQLDISQDQAPLLLKNARSLITENQQRYLYKPYSLFAQPLSHISEEVDDEQLLDTIETRSSYFSFRSSVPPPQPTTPPSHALCFFFTLQTRDALAGLFVSKDEDEMTGFPVIKMKQRSEDKWKKQMLCLSMLCVGVGRGWVLVFLPVYHYYVLELSMSVITCLVLGYNMGEWITTVLIEKYFERLNLILVTTCVHIVFILYVLIYPYLKVIPVLLFALQFVLGVSFQWMWLSTSRTVNTVTDTYYERMKLRATMSSLYSCVGPAIGVLVIGGCLDSIHDYAFLMNQCLFLFVASFLISWSWSL